MNESGVGLEPRRVVTVVSSEVVESGEGGRPFQNQEPVSIFPESGNADGDRNKYAAYSSMHRAVVEKTTMNGVVWGGELPADIYGARDLKGSGAEATPHIRLVLQPDGLRMVLETEGLYDHDEIEALEVSKEVREKLGLPTERPVAIHRLNQVWLNGGMVMVDEWRKWASRDASRAIDQFFENQVQLYPKWMRLPVRIMLAPQAWIQKRLQLRPQAKKYIDKVQFYVVDRDLQTEERLCEIARCKTEEEFKEIMGPVFKWLNVATGQRGAGLIPNTPIPKPFVIDNPEDINRYFGEWLPEQIGLYLGRMHKNNFRARYGHMQNWSAVGTLYDLSSCFQKMKGLNENEIRKQKLIDIGMTLTALVECVRPNQDSFLKQTYPQIVFKLPQNFLRAYSREMGVNWTEDELKIIHMLANRPRPNFIDDKTKINKEKLLTKLEYLEWVMKPLGFEIKPEELF